MLAWIPNGAPPDLFPPTDEALTEPNGLLAAGGDLSPERLEAAYRRGIFPWYSEGDPLLWWSPDPRAVLFPAEVRISRSLRKRLRQGSFEVSVDRAFSEVVRGCAAPRARQAGTWIDDAMHEAYCRLHARGLAHSVECWRDGRLAGGLYGVQIGAVFFGESMFSRETDASKVALVHLCRTPLALIDCQLPNPHLASLGARLIRRARFEALLSRWLKDTLGEAPSAAP